MIANVVAHVAKNGDVTLTTSGALMIVILVFLVFVIFACTVLK